MLKRRLTIKVSWGTPDYTSQSNRHQTSIRHKTQTSKRNLDMNELCI